MSDLRKLFERVMSHPSSYLLVIPVVLTLVLLVLAT